jgi:hypothetical protein
LERRKRLYGGMQEDLETGGQWVRLEIGFYSLFCVLLEGRDVFQVQTDVSWEGEVSPWPIITFWEFLQSILQKDNKYNLQKYKLTRGEYKCK